VLASPAVARCGHPAADVNTYATARRRSTGASGNGAEASIGPRDSSTSHYGTVPHHHHAAAATHQLYGALPYSMAGPPVSAAAAAASAAGRDCGAQQRLAYYHPNSGDRGAMSSLSESSSKKTGRPKQP
jgi:hypothetical protein